MLKVEDLDIEPATPADGEARVGQISLAVGSHCSRRGTEGHPRAWLAPSAARFAPGGDRGSSVSSRPTRHHTPASPAGHWSTRGGTYSGFMVSGWGRGRGVRHPGRPSLARRRDALEERGSVKRGYLGILSQPVRLPDGQSLGLTQRGGLLVVGVEEGSPAGRGGLIVGDILATLDGQPVEDTDDLLVLLVRRAGRESRTRQAGARRRARGARDHRRRARLGVRRWPKHRADPPPPPWPARRMIEDAQRSVVQVRSKGRGIRGWRSCGPATASF